MASAVYWVTFAAAAFVAQLAIHDPAIFEPPAQVAHDRAFVTETPQQLAGYFKTYTNLVANRLLSRYIGKWYAIAGNVQDVQDFSTVFGNDLPAGLKNQSSVALERRSSGPFVSLVFQDRWNSSIENLNKKDAIRAYCKIKSINSIMMQLNECELVSVNGR